MAEHTEPPPPIMRHCEGSACPTHYRLTGRTTCAMCGEVVPAYGDDAIAVSHQRRDVLAMIDRGDFG